MLALDEPFLVLLEDDFRGIECDGWVGVEVFCGALDEKLCSSKMGKGMCGWSEPFSFPMWWLRAWRFRVDQSTDWASLVTFGARLDGSV